MALASYLTRLKLKVTAHGRARLYDADGVEVLPGLIRTVHYGVSPDSLPEVTLSLVKVALEVELVEGEP